MASICAPLQVPGETLDSVLRIGWQRITTSFPFLKAPSCLLAASPVLDLKMFEVLPVRLAPVLGFGLVI